MFDKNKDGKISKDELMEVLQKSGQNTNETEVEKMIKELDVNRKIIFTDTSLDTYTHTYIYIILDVCIYVCVWLCI